MNVNETWLLNSFKKHALDRLWTNFRASCDHWMIRTSSLVECLIYHHKSSNDRAETLYRIS